MNNGFPAKTSSDERRFAAPKKPGWNGGRRLRNSLLPESRLHVSILASGVNRPFLYCFPVPVDKSLEAISSQVARLLKEERERRGLSLNELAQKAGLSRQTVSYVEQEVQNPTLDTLLRITFGLGVELEKVIARARKRALTEMD